MIQTSIPFLDELIVDNFAGGGGASTGIEAAFGRPVDIAVNHDPEAVAMHKANHPNTTHYCESVFSVDPCAITGNQPVGLAWFSPDCKHHSKAKGGKPRDKRIRGLAWIVIKWAKLVRPRVIMLENVEEFQDWGPLTSDGKPCPTRKGMTFSRWLRSLENRGYRAELRELRACDYGAPTTRKRLFIIARRDGLPIVWPKPTHGAPKSKEVRSGKLKPWRTAAECIDWSIPCPSIFDRTKPLAENTLRRIAKGIRRYVIEAAYPFIVPVTHHGSDRLHGIDEPFRTITAANRGEMSLASPFITTYYGDKRPEDVRGIDLREPLKTQTTENRHAIVSPTLIQTGYGEREGQSPRVPGLDKPLGTVVAGGIKHALVNAFMAKHYGGVVGFDPATDPMHTVTATDHHALVTSHLAKLRGTNVGHGADEPLQTIAAQGTHFAEVRAFLVKYYQTGTPATVDDPAPTITSKDRIGLVTVAGQDYAIVDIGMRMLTPRELFRAQGFRDDYVIDPAVNGKPLSKTAQVRMCGNSVCPPIAEALVRANFAHERKYRMTA